MNTLLEKLTLENKPIITGNFNLNLIKYMQNIGVNQFLENFLSNNFIPQITLPARITEKIATLIDNIGLLHSSWLEKLGFLVHESLCSSKQLQENVVHLIILCTLWLYEVHVFVSSHTSSCTKWNMLPKDVWNMLPSNTVICCNFLIYGLKGYPRKGNPDVAFHGKLFITRHWS